MIGFIILWLMFIWSYVMVGHFENTVIRADS